MDDPPLSFARARCLAVAASGGARDAVHSHGASQGGLTIVTRPGAYERAAELHSMVLESRFNTAMLHLAAGHHDEAIGRLEQASALAPIPRAPVEALAAAAPHARSAESTQSA